MNYLIIDVGGTFIKYATMNENGNILAKSKVPTPTRDRQSFVNAITALYEKDRNIKGIGISLPGIIDSEKGYIRMGGALTYNNDFYLKEELSKSCPIPIATENDAKCAALAEATKGSLKDVENGFILLFGTMIGGGLIMNHKLYRGYHFSAGEVSFIVSNRIGTPNREGIWGNRCSVNALCKNYAEKKQIDSTQVNGEIVFAAVEKNETEAIQALNEYAYEIAVQIHNIQTVYDPELIAIGGGISEQPVFIKTINEQLKDLYSRSDYPLPQAKITVCQFHNDANLYGAFQCLMEQIH